MNIGVSNIQNLNQHYEINLESNDPKDSLSVLEVVFCSVSVVLVFVVDVADVSVVYCQLLILMLLGLPLIISLVRDFFTSGIRLLPFSIWLAQ